MTNTLETTREFVRLLKADEVSAAYKLCAKMRMVDLIACLDQIADEQPDDRRFCDHVSNELLARMNGSDE